MNKVLLHFLILTLIASCQRTDYEKTYYEDVKTGEIFNRSGYLERKKAIKEQIPDAFRDAKVDEVVYDEVVRNDSTIITFDLVINAGGKPSKPEKLYSFKGKKLPSNLLTTLSDDQVRLKDFEGKPTVVNFWFVGCAPCIQEMPILNRFKEKYDDQVNFISVTFDDKEAVQKFSLKKRFDFLKIVDAENFIDEIGIGGFPKTLFLNKDGIVERIEGGIPYMEKNGKLEIGEGKAFEEYIKEML